MPNPYDDILNNDEQAKPVQPPEGKFDIESVDLTDPRFLNDGPEPLDEILQRIEEFNKKAETFSQLLSRLRVVDHKVRSTLSQLFLAEEDTHKRESLAGERNYHDLQTKKFEAIIVPMQALGLLHLETIKQFNRDIDKNYYSIEKTDQTVKSDINRAVDGINLQRKILADASEGLQILTKGLADTERRIKSYINIGGKNNISAAEYELLVRKSNQLSSGAEHGFDYHFFDVNLFDKTAISLGIYLKETTSQYLSNLVNALGSK